MASNSDKKFAELTRQRYNKARELSQEVFDRVEVNRNLYRGFLQIDDTYEWDYSLVDQQIFPLIRNYISRSNPSNTKVRLEARKPEDFEKRQINQDFINWEISELPMSTLLTRAFFSNYLAGKAYFKTGWKYDPRVVVKNGKAEYEMRPLTNRADLKFVRFNNIIMQLRVGDMLKDNETYGYEYWDKKFLARLKKYGVTGKTLDYEAEFVRDGDTKEEIAYRAATFPAVCMHTLEGEVFYIPLIGDNEDEIINKKRDNPFWHGHYPYMDMTAFPEDDEFYPMSVVDATGDLQIASTEVLNQTLTNIRSINNNMWIAGAPAATTPDYMFKQRPSGIIRVSGDPNQIVPVRPIDSTNSMLRVGQELNTKFEKAGGISSMYSSGAGSTQINQTARGAQIIDQNVETNVRMIMDLFGEQILKRVGDHFQELNAQYVTEEQTFAVTGKKGVRELVTISPKEVSANFDVYTYPEAMIKQTPASRQASLQNLLSVINRDVTPTGVQVDVAPLVENLIDSYPEMENIDDIVTSLDEKGQRDALMLERGQMPEVKVRDQHKELIVMISVHFEENSQGYDKETVKLFMDYIEKHLRYIRAEQEAAALTPQPQQGMMPPGGAMPPAGALPTGADVGQGTLPEATGTGMTNPYDLGNIVGGQQ
jgi:hypothetical protein